MPSGGPTAYAALNARVRVFYSTLLSQEEFASLSEAADFNGLIAQLKQTIYGPYLERVADKDLTPRRAAYQIRMRLADAYNTLVNSAPKSVRPLFEQLYRYFELNNLKAVLRGIVTGNDWETVRFVLFPYGSHGVLPGQEMVESGSITAAVELLRGTPYYKPLSFAVQRYSIEKSLFPLEVALDLDYWRDLWEQVGTLQGKDREHAMKLIGSLLDANNLMWAIRYRVYHNLSEEELINYTLPVGYKVNDEDIRAIAAGADIANVVKRIYPKLANVDSLIEEPHSGLPKLEHILQRQVAEQCHLAFIGNPFSVGIPLASLLLAEYEIQDLVVLIEAKSTQAPADVFREHLVLSAPEKV